MALFFRKRLCSRDDPGSSDRSRPLTLIGPLLRRKNWIVGENHVFVIQTYFACFRPFVGQRMFEPVGIIALQVVEAIMGTATFLARQRAVDGGLGTIQ